MTEVVIDTNVLLVADKKHADASLECVAACMNRLRDAQKRHVVVIDEGYRLLFRVRK